MSMIRYVLLPLLMLGFSIPLNDGLALGSGDIPALVPARTSGMGQEERKRSIDALKQSLASDRHSAETHARLAELYMQEGTLSGRINAERHLRLAIQIDADCPEYRVHYGRLKHMQGFHQAARGELQKALELDPQCAEAYYHLGVIHEEEMWHFRDMIDGPISFGGFAADDERKAMDCFRKVLQIDPNHRQGLFHLGLAYCEKGEFNEMAGLFRRILKDRPEDKDAHLFLGLALHRLGQGEESWDEYEGAKRLMGDDERTVFESIEGLLSPEAEKQYLAASLDERNHLISRFWLEQEPLFLTEYNERILEHYSRVAYANLRYGFPEKGIPGWQTDQGKVYIRYGAPLRRVKSRPSIEPGEKNPVRTSIEVWKYEDFDHVFEDMFLTGHYRFKWGQRPETDGLSKYTTLVKTVPQLFEFDYGGEDFEVPCQLASFRGREKKTSLDICYALPAQHLDYTVKQHESRISVEVGVFFMNEDWQPVVRDVRDEVLVTERIDPMKEYDVATQRTLLVEPGTYHFALEVRDRGSKNIGLLRDTVAVVDYDDENLQLSDILFAADIRPYAGEGVFHRGEYCILPNPRKQYTHQQPVCIYYEMYNLKPDMFGQTH